MDPDSKDNANPTVLDASALPTRQGRQQRTRQRDKGDVRSNDVNQNGGRSGRHGLAGGARGKGQRQKGRRIITSGEGAGSSDSNVSDSGSGGSDGSGGSSSDWNGGSRSRSRSRLLRNGRTKGNAFFDELLGGTSGMAVSRGYLDDVLDYEEGDGSDEVEVDEGDIFDDDDDDDDDEEADEIDEQEIYGTSFHASFLSHLTHHNLHQNLLADFPSSASSTPK